MKSVLRYFVLLLTLLFTTSLMAQNGKWKEVYKVKKKDTIFGIAKRYSLSIQELIDANPAMKETGYELKKDDYIYIPYAKDEQVQSVKEPTIVSETAKTKKDVKGRAVRIGMMLPLHDVDGDGRRMVEYYRGVLMACDSMRKAGISTDVYAWNVPIDADIRQTLLDKNASKCDLIFGPLYTKQVKALGDFCRTYGIKMVIPFSISGNDVERNPQIYQVYQAPEKQNEDAIKAFLDRFPNHHPVLIDCNDTTSRKGIFTMGLRKQLDAKGIKYNITNLKSTEEAFAKAFTLNQPNVVILNTGRSPELNVAMTKLKTLQARNADLRISLFGYTEWLMYAGAQLENFYRFDTYIPTVSYYNSMSTKTAMLEKAYRRWFGKDMQHAIPRFAITGYDQAQFFVRGLHRYGMAFNGTKAENSYTALQTPLNFKRAGKGGMRNENFMLIHYKNNRTIESISY